MVRAADSSINWDEILDRVESGEEIVITRGGRPVARLMPVHNGDGEEVARTLSRLREMRQKGPRATLAEMTAWRHEGHKY